MAWFFVDENSIGDKITLTGENAHHISKSLRMTKGEHITVCTPDGRRHDCIISDFDFDCVRADVVSSTVCEQEADVKITLFMALTKGDKMDDIVQKSVELGVYDIVPMLTSRCISRPDDKQLKKKVARWQKIADNAAMQSRRGITPKVHNCVNIDQTADILKEYDTSVVFYECGGKKLRNIINDHSQKIAIFIGSEGGFEQQEIDMLTSNGAVPATLGKRILRAQTAPLVAITAIMYQTNNLD